MSTAEIEFNINLIAGDEAEDQADPAGEAGLGVGGVGTHKSRVLRYGKNRRRGGGGLKKRGLPKRILSAKNRR